MELPTYPSTSYRDVTPTIDRGAFGVLITGPEEVELGASCVIEGAFRISNEAREQIREEVHRSLSVVVTSRFEQRTIDPFRRFMLFEDDERREPGGCNGAFGIDLSSYGVFRNCGTYHVTVSLQTHTSNTLMLKIG
ncbi:MAG: hypothetical protein OEM05_11890 [Myxococcales bacterium]|nr:hypothetical protein [Myxococcales bacterium]